MTADRGRRRRRTWMAFALGIAAVVVATVLSGVAVVSLSNSTAGRNAADDLEITDTVQRLPWTSTALLGVVDADGALTSSVVAVLPPDGRGGTIVSVSPSADVSSGTASIVRPLGVMFEVEGPEAWRAGVEQLTGLSFDLAEVVDAERFAELISPLGDLPTVFPFAFTDANTDTTFESGQDALSAAAAARAVTARNASGPAWQFDPVRDAVWLAVANRVGAGIGSLPSEVRFDRGNAPANTDQFVDALFAAPVDFRALSETQIDPVRVASQLPVDYAATIGANAADAVVSLDRAEVVLVFGSIAPARVGAPLDGPTVRVVSGYTDADAEALGMNRSDLIAAALDPLLFVRSNVRSVVDRPDGAVPERTRIVVAEPSMVDGVWATYGDLLGEPQVVVADVRIEGIDLEITLGREYLDLLADPQAAATATTPTSEPADGSESDSDDVDAGGDVGSSGS